MDLADKLIANGSLALDEYQDLIAGCTPDQAQRLAQAATCIRRQHFGDRIYTRGLIELTSHCANDCLYCGLRRSNRQAHRYRLTTQQVLDCADTGYELGFRTFVIQGGEDPYFTDQRLCDLVSALRQRYPDCAITLSMGQRSRESYRRLRQAGADRYLLRHESADPAHYAQLHPAGMTLESRMQCLSDLREEGFAVGVGFMVGSPYQTPGHLARDVAFVEAFRPEMCGIGPFVPHHATPFASFPVGGVDQTCLMLSILRIVAPTCLLPATTALATIDPQGRERGILSGANVVMPNLSPVGVRGWYDLYDNKACTGEEAAECAGCLAGRMASIGCQLVVDRGDPPGW